MVAKKRILGSGGSAGKKAALKAIALLCFFFPSLPGSAAPEPFSLTHWLSDFSQLKRFISDTYPNLESQVVANRLDLMVMSHETETALRATHSDEEATKVLKDFAKKFKDGHLQVQRPASQIEKEQAAAAAHVSSATDGQAACRLLVDAKPKDPHFLFPTSAPLGFTETHVIGSAFPIATLKRGGTTTGFLRIASFVPGDYPQLCEEEWAGFRKSIKGACDNDCRDKFVYEILSNRILHEFDSALRRLESEGASTLVLDITGNGGGSDWVGPVIRMVTARPILCGQFGFIRHPHWVRQFREKIAELRAKKKRTTGAKEKADIQTRLTEAYANLKQSQIKCDRSSIWHKDGYPPHCTLLVKHLVKDCSPQEDFKYQPGLFQGPLFVLVDHNTASAAEDLVGRLKDSAAATILGERTLGAGCGHTNGGIAFHLKYSGLKISMPDCARLSRAGQNEVEGISPDMKLPMANIGTNAFTESLEEALSRVSQ